MSARAGTPPRLATGSGWPYALERVVGRGASSEVWLARDPAGAPLALKLARDPSFAPVLADEAARLAGVDSPSLAAVIDAGLVPRGVPEIGGRAFVALEWSEGEALSACMGRSAAERLRIAQAVARDVGAALADLHRAGVAHGDVKPDNILVVRGKQLSARLIDLGLSVASGERTPRGATPAYLDPSGSGDARTRDLWALGKTLEELVPARAPEPLASIVTALLDPAPGMRPSASWVTRRARAGERVAPELERQRARRAVQSAYLAVRRAEIARATRHERLEIGARGIAREWLAQAVELQKKLALMRGAAALPGAHNLGDLDALGRARWLVALVGPTAAHWPRIGSDGEGDAELAERLLAAAERAQPESFTLDSITDGVSAGAQAGPHDPTELALALSSARAPETIVASAEQRVLSGEAPSALTRVLGRTLRARGEIGRALRVFEALAGALGAVEAAECERRAGEPERALARLDAIPAASLDAITAARAAAIRSRIALDRGDPKRALEIVAGVRDSTPVCEVRALSLVGVSSTREARAAVERGLACAADDEERARLEAVRGYVEHFAGDAEAALAAHRRAAEYASRAGAVVEEATYLTNLAAAATHVGELAEALTAAERALLLFEHLGRLRDAARAALARTSVYAIAGAVTAARDAAADALARARGIEDRRCRAYVHLALADVLPDSEPEGAEHAERAYGLLETPDAADRLFVAARRLRRGAELGLLELDELARDAAVAPPARLDWWGARARVLARAANPGADQAARVLVELSSLATLRAPIAVRGPALAAGAELAARIGDGDGARRLAQASREAARELSLRAPRELAPAIEELAWIRSQSSPRESTLSGEQLSDIESLVRALGHRERLRPLLDQVLDALVLWTGVERGMLLARAPAERLVVRAARNLARKDLDPRQLELSQSLAARALELGEPVVAVDAAGELPEVHASVHALKLRSVLAVPLIARGEALGVVYLDDRVRRGAFGPRELAWVKLVATVASVAIADARDQLLLRRSARRARRAEERLAHELARREAQLDVAERELAAISHERRTRFAYDAIVGTSEPLVQMLRMLDKVAAAEIPVLVIGESGSGKELVARAIHDNGPRRAAPFVSENCGAIPEPLLESALFGHVRGAFTGASRHRAGLFEAADGGTLFLDEIGEMSLGMQTKLLRVLEDGDVRAVGSERGRKVDVRVIGATHRDLGELVQAGKFRQDLLFRLDVISLRVPPLRERPTDIPPLVDHFLAKHSARKKLRLTRAALEALGRFAWPGNVRQLENEIRRALVLAGDASVIDLEHLSEEVVAGAAGRPGVTHELNVRQRVDALEVELVQAALRRTSGNQTRAAELLGLSRFGLQKMLKRLQIDPRRVRS